MYQSHVGYSGCGLGSEGTDRLVHLCRTADPAENQTYTAAGRYSSARHQSAKRRIPSSMLTFGA